MDEQEVFENRLTQVRQAMLDQGLQTLLVHDAENQILQHHILKFTVSQGGRIGAAAELVQSFTICLLADLLAVDKRYVDLRTAVEIGIDSPQRERNNNQHQNDRGDDALGFFTDGSKHAATLPDRMP